MESEYYTPQFVELMAKYKALLPPKWNLTTEIEEQDGVGWVRILLNNRDLYSYGHDDRMRIAKTLIALVQDVRKLGIDCYLEKTE